MFYLTFEVQNIPRARELQRIPIRPAPKPRLTRPVITDTRKSMSPPQTNLPNDQTDTMKRNISNNISSASPPEIPKPVESNTFTDSEMDVCTFLVNQFVKLSICTSHGPVKQYVNNTMIMFDYKNLALNLWINLSVSFLIRLILRNLFLSENRTITETNMRFRNAKWGWITYSNIWFKTSICRISNKCTREMIIFIIYLDR